MRNIIEIWKRWLAKSKRDFLYDEISRVAFQKWKARGYESGNDWKDWFEAEKEVVSRYYQNCCNNLSTD